MQCRPGTSPLTTVPAPQAVPIAAAETGGSPQTWHQAGPAVVEDPLRQVGELDADGIAEDREPDEGGNRRRGRDDNADGDERPARR